MWLIIFSYFFFESVIDLALSFFFFLGALAFALGESLGFSFAFSGGFCFVSAFSASDS